jgi:hypothetical protein
MAPVVTLCYSACTKTDFEESYADPQKFLQPPWQSNSLTFHALFTFVHWVFVFVHLISFTYTKNLIHKGFSYWHKR